MCYAFAIDSRPRPKWSRTKKLRALKEGKELFNQLHVESDDMPASVQRLADCDGSIQFRIFNTNRQEIFESNPPLNSDDFPIIKLFFDSDDNRFSLIMNDRDEHSKYECRFCLKRVQMRNRHER